jgi:hypothetical protein
LRIGNVTPEYSYDDEEEGGKWDFGNVTPEYCYYDEEEEGGKWDFGIVFPKCHKKNEDKVINKEGKHLIKLVWSSIIRNFTWWSRYL